MSYCTERNFEVAPGVYTHDFTREEVEAAEGCCQKFVCGIPCPAPFDNSGVALGFGLPVALVSMSWALMGIVIAVVTLKSDDYRGFFVCNRTLPYFVVMFALLGQGLDTSSSLGNVVNAYKFNFWDGAVVPIGVGLSLITNGVFLAAPINRMGLLTLPDLFRRKYGALMEVMVSFIEIASFTVLLAGNLVGISLLLQFCFGLPKGAGIAVSGAVLAGYTASGGLYSVALTDIPQALGGLSGLFVTAIYMLSTTDGPVVPPASKGFAVDLGGNVTARTPGYTGPASCVDAASGRRTCDNYFYPQPDSMVRPRGMVDPDAYAPVPNSILYNWASMLVLGFGNLCALDFQARCIAAKSPRTARAASLTAGCLLLLLAIPFGMLGGLARRYYGPDSPYASFEPDSCSADQGRPSCAQWLPHENVAVFMMLWEHAPRVIGAWAMIAMAAASVSTADGAILATATVAAHNLWRKVPRIGSNEANLLLVSRLFIVPMTLLACLTAMLAYRPAYLVVVSFDIVLAGVLVPLLAAVYMPNVSPNAGILSSLVGCLLRISLEQVLPKDGSLVAPLGRSAKAFGRALPGLPAFMQVDPPDLTKVAGVWDPAERTCEQTPLADWTGLDSVLSPVCALLTLLAVTALERRWPGVDLLWFVPRTWRLASPLYLSDDPSHRPRDLKMRPPLTPNDSRHAFRRAAIVMPSVPEEDYSLYCDASDAASGDGSGSYKGGAADGDGDGDDLDPEHAGQVMDPDLEAALVSTTGRKAGGSRSIGSEGSGGRNEGSGGEGDGPSAPGGGAGSAVGAVRVTVSGVIPEVGIGAEAPGGSRRRWNIVSSLAE